MSSSSTDRYALPTITDAEFRLMQRWLETEIGVFLTDAKRSLLIGRLAKRLRLTGARSFRSYYRRVAHDQDMVEREHLIDAITTNETRFFRETQSLTYFSKNVFDTWRRQGASNERPKTIRAWSVACSSGEEPYTLAMVLAERFPVAEGWDVQILATDISQAVLARAQAGVWPIKDKSEIPEAYLKKYMLRGTGNRAGEMAVHPSIKRMVRFRRLNLMDESYEVPSNFDLVFCRNVLIYFRADTKRDVVTRLIDHVDRDGFLVVGAAESLHGVSPKVARVVPSVYRPLARAGVRLARSPTTSS